MPIFKSLLLTLGLLVGLVHASPQITHLKKGDKEITLLGTIHIAKPSYYPLPEKITTALKNADALAVEVDLTDKALMSEALLYMSKNGRYQGQPSIIDDERLRKIAEIMGDDVEKYRPMKPWVIYSYAVMKRAQDLGFTEQGIDFFVINAAKGEQLPVISLETVTEQFDLINDLSDEESLKVIDSIIGDRFESDMQLVEAFWLENDAKAGDEMLALMQGETPIFYQRGIVDRNHTMAKRIVKNNGDHDKLFVAIGAAHLHGKDGVVALLEKSGYRISDK